MIIFFDPYQLLPTKLSSNLFILPTIYPSQKKETKGMIFLGNLPKTRFSFKMGLGHSTERIFNPRGPWGLGRWRAVSRIGGTLGLEPWRNCWANEKPFWCFWTAWKGRKRENWYKKHHFNRKYNWTNLWFLGDLSLGQLECMEYDWNVTYTNGLWLMYAFVLLKVPEKNKRTLKDILPNVGESWWFNMAQSVKNRQLNKSK